MPFFCIHISQGSVATCLKRGGYLNTNLLQIYCRVGYWKNFENRIMVSGYGQEFGVLFFWLTVYIYIYFSDKIYGSNFIKQHSETGMLWFKITKMLIAALKDKLIVLFTAYFRSLLIFHSAYLSSFTRMLFDWCKRVTSVNHCQCLRNELLFIATHISQSHLIVAVVVLLLLYE